MDKALLFFHCFHSIVMVVVVMKSMTMVAMEGVVVTGCYCEV